MGTGSAPRGARALPRLVQGGRAREERPGHGLGAVSTPPRPAGGILSKRSAWVASLYVVAILLLGSAVAITFGGSSRRLAEGLVPLKRQPLTAGGIRASFLAVWDEPHEVMVTLPTQSGLPEVDAFVASAAAHIGYYRDCPPFDLRWRAYENGVLIGSGSGARGAQ